MAELNEEYNIVIAATPVPATGDGTIKVEIVKFAPWFQISWNRQQLTHGITAIPSGTLVVEIPVEGVLPDIPLTAGQLAELLTHLMESVLPTCKVFVEAVEDDFGFDSGKEDF